MLSIAMCLAPPPVLLSGMNADRVWSSLCATLSWERAVKPRRHNEDVHSERMKVDVFTAVVICYGNEPHALDLPPEPLKPTTQPRGHFRQI